MMVVVWPRAIPAGYMQPYACDKRSGASANENLYCRGGLLLALQMRRNYKSPHASVLGSHSLAVMQCLLGLAVSTQLEDNCSPLL